MIGDRLKFLRKEKGLQAQYVADKINVAKSTYSGYENNNSQPDYVILQKLADLFGVSTDYLLGRDQPYNTMILENLTPYVSSREITIDQQLQEMLDKLNADGVGLMFKGKPMSNATKETLLISLKNALDLADKFSEMDKKNNANKKKDNI